MVESSRKKPKKRLYSGNHQRSWLWGYHAVTETLLTGRWPVIEIFSNQQAFEKSADLLLAKKNSGIPFTVVDSSRLEELAQTRDHQGLVIRLGQFPYQNLQTSSRVVKQAMEDQSHGHFQPPDSRHARPLVVICDRIQDSFNFGAILRSCDGVSVLGVIVGDQAQAEVTPHVVRSSSGAINHVPIIRVDSLIEAARRLQEQGLQLVAADANTKTGVWDADVSGATALVIGSEATGISSELLSICNQKLCIPMQGKVTSLNAAVAAGILLYEIRRQQTQ
jgi:23S rRNA (guanosine2251-2'-O)-methyltransferase